MSDHSTIEWTDATWNPVRGCTKISAGCKFCYAARIAERFRGVRGNAYVQGFDLRLVPTMLARPLTWTKSKMIFANSMSDLFHEGVPDEYIEAVAQVMQRADWHVFQVLTKRSERMQDLLQGKLRWAAQLPHIWWGVSVENRVHGVPRIAHLRAAKPAMAFLSVEPLLEDVGKLQLSGIDWVIVGGESGSHRPMEEDWVMSVFRQCRIAGIPFFFKQWGGFRKGASGRLLRGRTYDEMPDFAFGPVPKRAARTELIKQINKMYPVDWNIGS